MKSSVWRHLHKHFLAFVLVLSVTKMTSFAVEAAAAAAPPPTKKLTSVVLIIDEFLLVLYCARPSKPNISVVVRPS